MMLPSTCSQPCGCYLACSRCKRSPPRISQVILRQRYAVSNRGWSIMKASMMAGPAACCSRLYFQPPSPGLGLCSYTQHGRRTHALSKAMSRGKAS